MAEITYEMTIKVTVPAGTEAWWVGRQVEKMIENNSDGWYPEIDYDAVKPVETN